MPNRFFISDTHFGHANIIEYCKRPFASVEEMDEALVYNWNSVVGTKDKVYHLGDVFINRKAKPILHRLNGDKVLIKGNHDIFGIETYLQGFRDIRAYHVLDNILFSHIPVHPGSKGRFRANVHGHLHNDFVKDTVTGKYDPFYFSVCVEHINYTPLPWDVLAKLLKDHKHGS